MSDVMNPTPLKRTSRFDDDEISIDTNMSFLGDIHVLTTLLSGASPLNVYSSQSHDDDFGIESDSSFLGYIDGVYSFHENTSKPPGGSEELTVLQADGVEEYDYTVATSESTEGSSNPSVAAKCVGGIDKGSKLNKKKKSFKGMVSSLRRTFCCRSIKQKK